jgi:hypothetical protein
MLNVIISVIRLTVISLSAATAENRYTECHCMIVITLNVLALSVATLSVVMPSVAMLSVGMLSVAMLSVVMPSVIRLNVATPQKVFKNVYSDVTQSSPNLLQSSKVSGASHL